MTPKAHVYIIEDDPTMVGLLKTLLDMEGYQVSTFIQKDAVSIPDLLVDAKPDVLLMDVNLRNLDGMEVLQQIKSDTRLGFLKIIMSSGSDYTDLCQKYGSDKFLLKPYMPEDLIQMIRGLTTAPLI
jgi:DNA-binding response OmpR family regulator